MPIDTVEISVSPTRRSWSATSRTAGASGGTRESPIVDVHDFPQDAVGKAIVDVHDFPDAVGKAIPCGVYDVAANAGFVSVGVYHDTPVRSDHDEAWSALRYPDAREIFITADAGGSNAFRRLHPRQPPPVRHEQVEQDRTPPILVHPDQLARPTAPHLRDGRQPDREHDESRWSRCPRSPRQAPLPNRQEDRDEGVQEWIDIKPDELQGDWNYVIRRARSHDRSTSPFESP